MQSIVDNPNRAYIETAISEELFDSSLELTNGLKTLGARLVSGRPGQIEISFDVPETTIQGNGVVEGGALMTMLDYSMAFAVLSKLPFGQTCATTSITVNMLAAANPVRLTVNARVERVGRSVAFARAELTDPRRKLLLATSSASFYIMSTNSP